MTREEELELDGWEKATTYDEPRLSEMVELYKELGYEVHLEPLNPEEELDCAECMKLVPENYKTVYTRKPSP
jgi:hypothetical protein